ncbi:ABC transporter G family member 22-like isoform X2 [Telopea speciosissima]|uniref:ABC transporter G family member 22-like isoform X2 n=1 Tax=Telopea speciosissima TaxID=54955 RepID=UPI001CC4EAB5|nr:ABC transporter G family member 22-like isoform X2 [Telopea speciosissima]
MEVKEGSTAIKPEFVIPQRKSVSKTSRAVVQEDVEPEIGSSIQRKSSFGRKIESPSKKSIKKTKSLSAHFLVDIEELVSGTAGSFSDKGSVLSHASSIPLGFSFSLAGATVGLDNASDVLRLKDEPDCQSSMNEMPVPQEEDPDFCNKKKFQIAPTLSISLKFQDVKYKVPVNGGKKTDSEKYILHGITGSVQPGEVLALMGPSGGGKTTLLNVLSGRVRNHNASGSITYNNQPFSKSLKQRICFVLQDDIVFPHLTVKETLTYSALLRLPNTLTKEQKEERVMDVVSELSLERCQNTIIGGAFVRGISGGERKRVCIGNEILLNPSLLFLDEPTSGLDSTTALRIVQMLHNLAEAGRTVVTTIHQPSSRLFNKFDKLILLGKGRSLYFGKASEAMLYFSSIGCSPLIAMNPADFLIDLANGNINDKSIPPELEDKELLGNQKHEIQDGRPSPLGVHEYLIGAYETRVAHLDKRKLLKPEPGEDELEITGWSNSREGGATWWEQYCLLFSRGLKERRHEYLSSLRVIQVISMAIITGLLWWRSDASSPKRLQDQVSTSGSLHGYLELEQLEILIQNECLAHLWKSILLVIISLCLQAGLLFFISVFWGFFPVFTAVFTFPQERAMLAKERAVDMYKLSAYFVARSTSDLPLDLSLPVLFLVIVYFMVGLRASVSAFSLSMLTIFLSIVAAQGLGLAIGAAFMDVKKATTVASVIVMTFMLSGGFFVQKVPAFMSWIRYISFNYHTYRLLLKIQYSCSDPGPDSGSCNSSFIKVLRLDEGEREVIALIAMVIGYRLLGYFLLRGMKLRASSACFTRK